MTRLYLLPAVPAPKPGEHTDSVLSELGVPTEQLAELREAGVVA